MIISPRIFLFFGIICSTSVFAQTADEQLLTAQRYYQEVFQQQTEAGNKLNSAESDLSHAQKLLSEAQEKLSKAQSVASEARNNKKEIDSQLQKATTLLKTAWERKERE